MMPTRRRRLTSVARSVISRSSQRAFSRVSRARAASNMQSARQAITPTVGRRYVRYSTPRTAGARSRLQVRSRRDGNVAVGRYVGMAH